jgi:hypothetical protein
MKKILQKCLLPFKSKSYLLAFCLKNLHIKINAVILQGCVWTLVRENEIQAFNIQVLTADGSDCEQYRLRKCSTTQSEVNRQCGGIWLIWSSVLMGKQLKNVKQPGSITSFRLRSIISQKTVLFIGHDLLGITSRNHKIQSNVSLQAVMLISFKIHYLTHRNCNSICLNNILKHSTKLKNKSCTFCQYKNKINTHI